MQTVVEKVTPYIILSFTFVIFFHFLGAACVGAFFFTVSYIHYATTVQKQAKPPLSTTENAGDYLGLLAAVAAGPG